ncbi:hypothetical protein [Nocardioides litoris]|uniref:hypothetical protein n=1 Tax=Nocardioides litoris TaxID=1926648 RepID=UPI00111E9851|nr:hypothetical protein [Nocardioides litoris]
MPHPAPALRTALLAVPLVLPVLSVLSGAPATAAPPAPGAAAAAATCEGRPATVIGEPGQGLLRGTPGPDVVVSGGARSVQTYGGDDLVCVDVHPADLAPVVRTGDGADRVVVTSTEARGVRAVLGRGADTFVGGPGGDQVGTGTVEAGGTSPDRDAGRDVVETRGGDDAVQVGGATMRDTARLGDGDDRVFVAARRAGTGAWLQGGAGRDEVVAWGPRSSAVRPSQPVVVDNGRGVATRAGARWWRFGGLEGFDLSAASGSVTFRGSGAAESLVVDRPASLEADLGPGRDAVRMLAPVRGARLAAGPGRDRLDLRGAGDADVDLGLGRARVGSASAVTRSFADLGLVVSGDARFRGTDQPNSLRVVACSIDAAGLGGADALEIVPATDDELLPDCRRRGTLRGGPGADVLVGSLRDDVLLGGPGRDSAAGGRGSDLCRAERRVGCER